MPDVSNAVKLSKSDAARALSVHHFTTSPDIESAFHRLRSIQFDPIAPVGCNHDLVLQSRVPGYEVGAWEKSAYQDRFIYDGWDKQASLVPFEGWPLRRFFYSIHHGWFQKRIFDEHPDAVTTILKEIETRGPLMPKDFELQKRNDEWTGSWFGPSVTKQTLRALWHTGQIMTSGRQKGQHIYDLTERVVPRHLIETPELSVEDSQRELVMERHRAMGIVRPTAPPEVWSMQALTYHKRPAIEELVRRGEIIPVEIEGVKAHATPDFLNLLDAGQPEAKVTFVAPLDPFMWDRKMVAHIFGFDYIWEIYTPVAKRKWGYYVLPILFGSELVARVEFWCRGGVLEMREWHWEDRDPGPDFLPAFEEALRQFMGYCSAKKVTADRKVDRTIRQLATKIKR